MTIVIRRNTSQQPNRYQILRQDRTKLKKTVTVVLLLAFMLYLLIDFKLKNRHFEKELKGLRAIERKLTLGNIIDTPGCLIPYFNASDKPMDDYTAKYKNFSCQKPLMMLFFDKPVLALDLHDSEILKLYNVSDIEKVNCYYNEIRRKVDQEQNEYLAKIPFQFRRKELGVTLRPDYEFINVECVKANGELFYQDFHFMALNKSKIPHTAATNDGDKMATQKQHYSDVSVMIFGLDSVSHLNFLRQMKQTSKYIRENLTHVEFWGYNTIANSCFDNLIPILTGMDESELDKSCRSTGLNETYDNCDFIWKHFKAEYYQTIYAEDVAQMSLFTNNMRPGFKRQPTDYYLHPLIDEMEKHIGYEQIGGSNLQMCKGGRRSVDVLFEMIHRLEPLYREQLFFSFFWTVTMTHDYQSMPQLLDNRLLTMLAIFEQEGILNKTVIFLISDHGWRENAIHESYEDMVEERQPLLIALYPRWMRQRYPIAIANLELNSKRLTTPFDLHNTLIDLLRLFNLEDNGIHVRTGELQKLTAAAATTSKTTIPRGISLFLPIPETRTCELAGIASHWCSCQEEVELSTENVYVQQAALHAIEYINDKLKKYPQCHRLHLFAIEKAFGTVTHSEELKMASRASDYGMNMKVHVQVLPSLGRFQSTVWVSTDLTASHVSDMKVIESPANQNCIDNLELKRFCICKDKMQNENWFLD